MPAELLARVATLLRRHAVRRHFTSQPFEAPTAPAAAPLAEKTPPPVQTGPLLATALAADYPAPPVPRAAETERR